MPQVLIKTQSNTDLSEYEFPQKINLHIENEISFLVPVTIINQIESNPDKYPLEKFIIEQRYFTNNFIPVALDFIQKAGGSEFESYEPWQFSQARMRRTVPLNSDSSHSELEYELTLKSPKYADGERLEITRKLSLTEYLEILAMVEESDKYSQKGYLLKERSKLTGMTDSGAKIELEIDHIMAAGNEKKYRQYNRETLPYLKVGCETGSMAGVAELRAGQHNIEFLKDEEVILLNKEDPISSYMSMSYIASKGIKENKIRSLLAEAA